MSKIVLPLPSLQLDPRNTTALLNAMQTQIYIESKGILNDFTPASPLSALTEGQVFAHSELLYYLNNLPEAFVLSWLKLLGIQRVVGSHSYAELRFLKQQGYARTVFIPKDTVFYTASGLKFYLLEAVEISPTEDEAIGVVRSEKYGEIYNVSSNTITKTSTAITGLAAVFNTFRALGGLNQESVGEMKSRALNTLRNKSIVTKEDYFTEINLLFPDLASVGVYTYEELSPYVEGLSKDVVYITFVQRSTSNQDFSFTSARILKALRLKTILGTNIVILPPKRNDLRVTVSFEYNTKTIGNLTEVCNNLYKDIKSSINPDVIPIGSQIFLDYISLPDNVRSTIVSMGSVKLLADEEEPAYGLGCSDDYLTFRDEDNSCVIDYKWLLSTTAFGEYFPSPMDIYDIFEVVITATNSDTFDSTIFTFKNV